MIIFEGPDGAGKTTLIEAFQDAFNIPVAPRVVTKDTKAMVNLQTWVDKNLDEGFQYTIFDRYRLISESIYGPILRGTPQPGFSNITWMAPRLDRFYRLKPIIIYCLPPLETVKANLLNDPDNTAVESKIDAIYSAYVARAALDYSLSPGTVKIWDYTRSLQVDHLPTWFYTLHTEILERLDSNDI